MTVPFGRWLSRPRLATKLHLLVIPLILATVLGIGLFVVHQKRRTADEHLLTDSQSLAGIVAQNAQYAIYTEDTAALRQLTASLTGQPDVAYVTLYRQDRRALVTHHLHREVEILALPEVGALPGPGASLVRAFGSVHAGHLDLVVPVLNHAEAAGAQPTSALEPVPTVSRIIGYVQLGVSRERADREIADFMKTLALFAASLVTAGLLLTVLLTRAITTPLQRLATVAHEIADGRFETPIDVKTHDEVAELAHAFGHMRTRLREYRAQIEDHARALEETVASRTAALREARELARRADDASRAKSQFLANMSHEIRTPMNGILGTSDLLLRTQLTAHQRRLGDIIRRSGDALLELIDDILDFSKIEAGRLELHPAQFRLRDAVDDVVELLAPRAQVKGLELSCLVDDPVPDRVIGDARRLSQVLNNLIGNAIKFTDQGEVTLHVTVAERRPTAALLRCEVHDTGIGISPEMREHVFELFVQADGSSTRRHGGTGLGLAITRQLVVLMGGAIGVDSTPGRGSTFWFTVPLELPAADPSERTIPATDLARLSVLVVANHASSRTLLEQQIRAWGLSCTAAADPAAALERLRAAAATGRSHDVVVVDLPSPGTDGPAFARMIRGEPGAATVHVIALGVGEPMTRDGGVPGAGIDAYLVKPLRQSALYNALLRVATRARSDPGPFAPPPASAAPAARPTGRVLVAEDNPVNQEVAVHMLESLGCRVELVGNGRDAVAAAKTGNHDVILMDCQMPELDGFGATRAIRALEEGSARRTPIVALTAHALTGDREQCLDAGMDDYLSKPFTVAQLQAVLERWLPSAASAGDDTAPVGSREPAAELAAPNGAVARAPSPVSGLDALAPIDPKTVATLRQLERAGRPEIVGRVFDLYFSATPPLLDKLSLALEQGDPGLLAQTAHALKSSSGNVGALRLAAISRQLEMLGRGGTLEGADGLVAALRGEYAAAQAAAAVALTGLQGAPE